jgi:hypothetical protein
VNNDSHYPDPVSQLLDLGETKIGEHIDYLELGFTEEDVPDLIRLVQDDHLRLLPWDDDGNVPPEVYAQVHAWRTLTQLGAEEAIPVFLDILYQVELDHDEFVDEEIPRMLAEFGQAAIEPSWKYLLDPAHGLYSRITAAKTLELIGQKHPKTRDRCVSALVSVLGNYARNDGTLNGFLISYLVDLEATEHIDLIERAFAAHAVDLFVMGDFEMVQAELGME